MYESHIAESLDSIAKSLSILAEDTKASRKTREELLENYAKLEESLKKLQDDPFELNKRN